MKIYPHDKRMWFTMNLMLRMNKNPEIKYNIGSRLYEFVRTQVGIRRSGANHHLFGKGHTIETRKKMSESRIGTQSGADNPFYGKHHTDEAKAKISEAKLGVSPSEETRKKIGASKLGVKFSPEHCKKISESKKNPSEEVRRNYSNGQRGRVFSDETKKKMSESVTGEKNHFFGKTHTKSTKEQMRRNSGTARPVIINNVSYHSVKHAAEELNLTKGITTRRLKSKSQEWQDWNYVHINNG